MSNHMWHNDFLMVLLFIAVLIKDWFWFQNSNLIFLSLYPLLVLSSKNTGISHLELRCSTGSQYSTSSIDMPAVANKFYLREEISQ